ncbi:MAG: adenylosuccinate synthase [Zetaproteobacteria bacterium]|nr:adenylosuccinate synthase [Zetaproteobacteria bacterium]
MIEILVGAQWGDEGKGKWVDILGEQAGIVARFQGGNNAGHTLIVGGQKIVLHQLPSGVLRPHCIAAILSGVVVDPVGLVAELAEVASCAEVAYDRLWISARAHIITPYHVWLDERLESGLTRPIGTTKRGIGPTYMDKAGRSGLTAVDLMELPHLEAWIERRCAESADFAAHYRDNPESWEAFFEAARRVSPYICDAEAKVRAHLRGDAQVKLLMEGAQGTLLDMNHGTYPFVTSSNPTAGGAVASLGIDPRKVSKVYGIAKAYTTRVGEGPFPTECQDHAGQILREQGAEFGATTGRPRRCGWYDAVAMRYASEVNGFDGILLNKLDVLSGIDELKICIGYQHPKYGRLSEFPSQPDVLAACRPVYRYLGGWREDIRGVRALEDLPLAAKNYVTAIQEFTGVAVKFIGTGPGRQDFADLTVSLLN